MTDVEKQQFADEVGVKKLGCMWDVCGKVFKNRDALEFHILSTKMPGHDVLLGQKLKSTFASAGKELSAKLRQNVGEGEGGVKVEGEEEQVPK